MSPGSRLVGRRDELTSITAAMKRADVAGVVVVGHAGIGKTRLIDEALDIATDAGFVVTRIIGNGALADIPLGSFASMLSGRPVGDAGDLVELRRVIRAVGDGSPVVLGVDDAHFLDDASAALVHQLAAELSAFVVAGVRADAIPPAAITALWKDHLAVRVDIGPLGRADVAELVESTMGVPADPELESILFERSAGNPMFVRELLAAARDAGALVEVEDHLSLSGSLPAPGTVVELLATRLAELNDAQRRAAGLLAVGGSLDIDLLESLVDPDALVELERIGMIRADEAGHRLEVRFTHPLHGEAVAHAMGRLAARQLRRELADALEQVADTNSDHVLRIVTLRLEAGAPSATGLLQRATELARKRNDPALMERLARATMDQAPTLAGAVAVASAMLMQGRHADAAQALADPRIVRAAASPAELVAEAEMSAWVQFWGLGRADAALESLRAAMDLSSGPRLEELRAVAASMEAACGRPRAALELLGEADGQELLPPAYFAFVTATASAGRPAAAVDRVPMPGADAPGSMRFAAMAHGLALIEAGRRAQAVDLAVDRIEGAIRMGNRAERCCWSIVLGHAETNDGRTELGRRYFDEAARLAVGIPSGLLLRRWALAGSMLCAAVLGDLDGAEELDRRLAALPAHDAIVHEVLAVIARAFVRAGRGDLDGAVAELFRQADDAIAVGWATAAVHLVSTATRLAGHGRASASWLEAHPLELDGTSLPAIVAWIDASARGDGDALADIAEQLVLAGQPVAAAEAAAASWTIARETGVDERTVAARGRRAHELRSMFTHASTPLLVDAPVELPLSRREREIATLVAGGRTSREVAETLVIGVRTVESHLARVYGKLGISSRADLAVVLGLEAATP